MTAEPPTEDAGRSPDSDELRRALEALILVSDQPAEPSMLAELLGVSVDTVDQLARRVAAEFAERGSGFVLARVAGGWRFESHPDCAPWVERYVLAGQSTRLSAAALETLAIIAYKQPISRAQVSAVRGVNADGVIRTLTQRGYVDEIARDPGPGQAVLLGTTRDFLERMGLDSLEELPGVADFVPGPEVVEALERGLALDATEPAELFDGAEPTELLDEAEAPDHSPPPPDLGVAEAPEQIDPSDPPDPR
ncbi:MAG: SMC-Scp complex subunit ScpB [Microthrixaceae bacterium]|nr:SMC-Scp complex subunit ScpB [Microthrixaceae bacterium]